jgi:ssDNA-binding Zn-finger/Zn-ribbon topoisomerase 1
MSTWYLVKQSVECCECGFLAQYSASSNRFCPNCGWTSKQQTEFDRKLSGLRRRAKKPRKP